jgi:hypothetical protein
MPPSRARTLTGGFCQQTGFQKMTHAGAPAVKHRIPHAILLLALALAGPAGAQACTPITTLPAPISQPGTYCLAGNLQASQPGIFMGISSSDVVVDLRGYTVTCANGGINGVSTGNATTLRNVHVRGGSIVGCNVAVSLQRCSGCSARDLVLVNNAIGISAGGEGVRVEGNLVRADSGSFSRPAIQMQASNATVRANAISGGEFGIDNEGKNNLLRDNDLAGCSFGIRFFQPATWQGNLARCTSNYSGVALGSSVDAGGNR